MSSLILPEGFNKKPKVKAKEEKKERQRSCFRQNTSSNRLENGCSSL